MHSRAIYLLIDSFFVELSLIGSCIFQMLIVIAGESMVSTEVSFGTHVQITVLFKIQHPING